MFFWNNVYKDISKFPEDSKLPRFARNNKSKSSKSEKSKLKKRGREASSSMGGSVSSKSTKR